MFPAAGQDLKLGRGALLAAPHDGTDAEDGYEFMGNIPSLELSWETETREKYSSTQASSPLLAQAVIRQDLSIVAQCDAHTKTNLKRFFFATEATADQAAASAHAIAINGVSLGRVYDLGARNVSAVSMGVGSTALIAGVDYDLYAVAGLVMIRASAANLSDGENITGTCMAAQTNVDHVRLGKVSEQFAKLMYVADDANATGISSGDRFVFWKAQVTPDGAYQLVSDDYTSFSLRFKILSDPSQVNDPLGRFERVRAA